MGKLLTIIFIFICVQCFGQLSDLFKYSTIYTSASLNNSLFTQGIWQMTPEGQLVDVTRDNPYDFSINIGIRKLARFEYQKKKGEFYTGEEREFSDKSNIGAVNGLEYKFQINTRRQQGREFENRHFMVRYLGDYYTIKAEQLFNGLADIKLQNIDTRLRLKIGNKINITAGVMNAWRPLGYEYNAIAAYQETGNPWYQLAYDYGFEDQYYFIDGNQNGVDDWFDWYDWTWTNPEGEVIAQTDYEFYKYHFGKVVREYTLDVQDSLGMVRELNVALGASFYHYGERFWIHAFGDVFPKRWLEEIDEEVLRFIELDNERIDYSLGFILGSKLGKMKRFGLFIEGDYNKMFGKEFFHLTGGLNYLIY